MGSPVRFLSVVVALLWTTYTPGCWAERCGGLRHLENGRTFFRYGGLYVTFRCDQGFKLHGYHTNSCASGHWSRAPPVCVASGCPSPSLLPHGVSTVTKGGSWVGFSCNHGYRLHGPSLLYCKGRSWNDSQPVCKESDMMTSWGQPLDPKPQTRSNMAPGLLAPAVLKDRLRAHYITIAHTAAKDAILKPGMLANVTPNHRVTQPNLDKRAGPLLPKVHSEEGGDRTPIHKALSEEGLQALRRKVHYVGSEPSGEQSDREPPLACMATTSSSSSSSSSSSNSSPPSSWTSAVSPTPVKPPTVFNLSAMQTLGTLRFTPPDPSSNFHSTPSSISSDGPLGQEPTGQSRAFIATPTRRPLTAQTHVAVIPYQTLASSTRSQTHAHTQSPLSPPPSPSPQTTTPSITTPLPAATSGISQTYPSSANATSTPTQGHDPANHVPSLTNEVISLSAATPSGSPTSPALLLPTLPEHQNLPSAPPRRVTLHMRPICRYPPVPAHGTFYFRSVANPRPGEYRHYVQYACYPGYSLAHGDAHSYCQQGATWSGVTPVCLEVTPCVVNNGGCSQLCVIHPLLPQQAQCRCRAGFTLLEDQRTCRDIDECVEGHPRCQQECLNMLGSFRCSCAPGFQLAEDGANCTDVNECLLPVGVTSCVFGCVNTPGSFLCQCPPGYTINATDEHCQDIDECWQNQGLGPCGGQCHNSPGSYRCSCPYGHTLEGDGRGCIAQCPTGYRRHAPMSAPGNISREECVDIDECQEGPEGLGGKCEWRCVNLPGSHRCICPKGYTLHKDTRHCRDINECTRKNGGCSHLCVNHRGGHKCACPPSHRLSPYSRRKCVPRDTQP